jgi:hypothetical protein
MYAESVRVFPAQLNTASLKKLVCVNLSHPQVFKTSRRLSDSIRINNCDRN